MNYYTSARNILIKYINRNRGILSDLNRPVIQNRVNLHWWQPTDGRQNVGDRLSPVIVENMKERYGIQCSYHVNTTRHLYAIGSIIDGGYQSATIWGSGILSGNRKFWWRRIRKLDVRAVRGPETRRTLLENGIACPEVYGDPAILLPLFYSPSPSCKKYKYRVIHHHLFEQQCEFGLSPLTDDWKSFIDEIVKSELIISSSLHGIILAEAYGVPAILLGTNLDLFKFRDYYYSTGRFDYPIAESIQEALRTQPAPLPDLSKLQNDLIRSFPTDIWQ